MMACYSKFYKCFLISVNGLERVIVVRAELNGRFEWFNFEGDTFLILGYTQLNYVF
jgi:hypothetical protein